MSITYGNTTFLKKNNLGNALKFNGSSTYINMGKNPSSTWMEFNPNDEFSISFSVYLKSLAINQYIIKKMGPGNAEGFFITTRYNDIGGIGMRFRISGNGGGTAFAKISNSQNLFGNRWYNITMTKESGYTSTSMKIYVNGVEEDLKNEANGNLTSINWASKDGFIGSSHSVNYLNGYLANLMKIDKVISQDEINYIYRTQGGVPPTVSKSEISYLTNFNEKKGTILKDYSENGYDGTLVNYSASDTDVTSGTNKWVNADTLQPITQ